MLVQQNLSHLLRESVRVRHATKNLRQDALDVVRIRRKNPLVQFLRIVVVPLSVDLLLHLSGLAGIYLLPFVRIYVRGRDMPIPLTFPRKRAPDAINA